MGFNPEPPSTTSPWKESAATATSTLRSHIVWVLLSAVQILCAVPAAGGDGPAPADEHTAYSRNESRLSQPAAPGPPRFADDTLTYVFGPFYRNPHIATPEAPDGADIARHALEFKHIDTWKYGHNLVEVIIKKSSDVEPAAGGGTGVLALYSVVRSGISLNRVAGTPSLALGPLRDIALEVGVNLETKNSDYAPEERTLYLGPSFRFRLGSGLLSLGLHLRKEWNHNGALGLNESYDLDFNIEPVWHFPFRLGGAKLAFDGFADLNTPKGKDGFGYDTRTEIIVRPQLKLDISRVFGQKERVVEVGIGFQYFHNMFGKSAETVPGAKELTPIFALAVHLPMGRAEGH